MNFNTQICTTREQSKRLLALGVRKETADMSLLVIAGEEISRFEGDINIGGNVCVNGIDVKGDVLEYVPAWSLHRLWALLPLFICDDYRWKVMSSDSVFYINRNWRSDEYSFSELPDIYENIISCVEFLINQNYFNKEYLEERK